MSFCMSIPDQQQDKASKFVVLNRPNSMWNSIPMIILLFSLPLFATTGTNDSRGMVKDRLSLIAIRSKIQHNPRGILMTWNDSVHHCNWEGVTCGSDNGRVMVLNLTSSGLLGSLSPSIGNLSFLEQIYLSNNRFYGQIPPQLGRLSHLRVLLANNNEFEQEIPSNISSCLRMEQLDLSHNKLEGQVPSELATLVHLQHLSLSNNNLRGSLHFLGNLTSLKTISMVYNVFAGEIPEAIGKIQGLTVLQLGGNQFIGQIPSSIYNLSTLVALSVGGSPLVGSLPHDIGLTLPRLRTLQIQYTNLTGSIPPSLSNLSSIENILLSANNFKGKISLDGRKLLNLTLLYLDQNSLGSGQPNDLDFLGSLTNCSRLTDVILGKNNLRGTIPLSLANLSPTLERLNLGENLLTGNIPPGLGNLVSLTRLNLVKNQLTGSIPKDIGKLNNLGLGYLGANKFSGIIPASLGNLAQLVELDLEDNELQGPIPPSLGNCTNLQYLNLSSNRLSGNIPIELFRASKLSSGLYLRRNELQGILPPEISQLKNLRELDVSENRLSGQIPPSLGECTSLIKLNLESNFLSGSIPSSLKYLRGISNLDLSSNNLSGQVPTYLATLGLDSLNLSFNNFNGEVPSEGIFRNASAVSLAGNNGLCGGITELHLPQCSSGHSGNKKRHLALILAIVLPSLLVSAIIAIGLVWFNTKRKTKVDRSNTSQRKSFLKVSYDMLLKATDGFSSRNMTGAGGFGTVYRGVLNTDGNTIEIAVKVFNLQVQGSSKSFMRECEAMRNIRHRNLLRIVSACSGTDHQGNDFKALIYEFMPNGNLEKLLYPNLLLDDEHQHQMKSQRLSFLQRINIAIDVGRALEYLHHECEIPIIHCDLKPSNILLDEDMVAHVGDFGLARLLPKVWDRKITNSISVQGTMGYTAPEYGLGNRVSTVGDIYSYGIILLELMTGKRPTSTAFHSGLTLPDYAKIGIQLNVMEIVDPAMLEFAEKDKETNTNHSSELGDSSWLESVSLVLKIGVECAFTDPRERASIKDAIRELNLAKDILLGSTTVISL